jgi:hypothetical protein
MAQRGRIPGVAMASLDAREHLQGLIGRTIHTLTGAPNTILRLEGDRVIVGTRRSPSGKPVPVEWVQSAADRLLVEGEIDISVASVGYRSAFIGAVLLTIPGTRKRMNPPGVALRSRSKDDTK